MTFELEKHSWDILDSYFANISHYISKNQIDSFNMFTDEQIAKTIRQFNPFQLNYEVEGKNIEVDVMVGGSVSGENVVNDGSSIKIGKPIIYEKYLEKNPKGELVEHIIKRQLYPNEAKLKNLTYTMSVYVDIHCLYREKNIDNTYKFLGITSFRNKLLGKIPAMLHSKICVLSGIPQNNLKDFGECQYDQGGYFIIDGKEKVITAQTRQVENKVYVYHKVKDDKIEYHAEIRSVPEDKLQPARITNVYLYREELDKDNKSTNKDSLLYVTIPNFKEKIPIFILFRALGVVSDKEILELMIGDLDSEFGNKLSLLLYDNILISSHITTQVDAIRYLQNIIRNFAGVYKDDVFDYSDDTAKASYLAKINDKDKNDFPYIFDILYNYLLPHVGTSNLYDKAIFLGYMVNQILLTKFKILEETDRDNYMYKRIDVSGFLVATIFRDLYFRVQNNFKYRCNQNFVIRQQQQVVSIDNINSLITSENIDLLMDQSIMSDGFKYAFKNCWGLRNAPCKEGVVQDLARLTYVGMTSHLRRVVTPIDASNKLRGPHMLHLSTYGILCPIETPDGANVGVKTNIALFTDITFGTHSNGVYQALIDNNMIDLGEISVSESYKRGLTKIFLMGRLVGYTDKPDLLTKTLRLYRRNAIINIYTSIAWYIGQHEIKISTDSGRSCHPLIIVKSGNKLSITDEIFRGIKERKITWSQLVGGTLREWNQYDNKYHRESITSDLENTSSLIEFLDTEEANTCMIAMNSGELNNSGVQYTHCEINPCIMFGIMGQLIPYVQTNQLPRNLYSCGQCKQAIGIYASNFRNRMDTKTQILQYPEKPLVQNRIAKHLYNNQLPYGINIIVAIACYSGYNQDDSIIANRCALDRGLFKTTKFRTYAIREEVSEFTKLRTKICNPILLNDPNIVVQDLKPGNYNKLGENGIILEGVKADENDIVCGKVIITNTRDAEGRQIYKDASEYVRRAETGVIDKVFYSYDNNDFLFVKVRLRKEKRPELGDKFASRAGQKGIMGMTFHEEDMPFTKHGIRPDMIINPQAFPKRMTISQFIETQQTKQCSLLGIFGDSSPFQDIPLNKMGEVLESLGFEKTGCEMLYNGMTGDMLEHEIFIGPTYYGRLQHQVEDKMHSRDTGAVTMLTKQPTGGRSIGGGLRIGEMERDALLSHGVSGFLKESMMERSDKHDMTICNGCGFIAMVNPNKNVYKCYACNSTKVTYYDSKLHKDQVETSKNNFSRIEVPYGMKLMTQELEAMSIASRIIVKGESSKWNEVDKYTNTLEMNTHIPSLFTTGDNTDLYRVSTGEGKDIPFRKYQNLVKDCLLNGAQNFVTGGRQPHLLDLSTYKGGDMLKWILNKYGYVLALDQNPDNIYKFTDCFVNRLSQAKEKIENANFFTNATIDYGISNINKYLYDASAFENTNLDNMINLKNILKRRGKNSFDIVSLQFTIQHVFDNSISLDNCLRNISDSLRLGGVALISCLDGAKIFDKLTKTDHLIFSYRDNVNRIPIYAIHKMYESKLEKLPDNKDGFGFKVNLQFGNSGKGVIEYLVNNTYLISEAKKYGLKIMDLSDFSQNFAMLDFPYDSFTSTIQSLANVKKMTKHLADDDNYKELKKFSKYHKYFVFVKVETNTLTSDNIIKCNRLTHVKLSKSSLSDILYERTLLGQVNKDPVLLNTIPIELENSLITKLNIGFKYDNLYLYNTLQHTNKYTKSSIYCFIKNNSINIYTPTFNTQNLETNYYTIIEKEYEAILETNLNKYRYYPELASQPIYGNKSVWYMDGCKLKTDLFQFNDLYVNTIRHMLEELLKNRNIPDCEFVLTLDDKPLPKGINNINILGLSTSNYSNNIALPTPLDWHFITKQYFVSKEECQNKYFSIMGLETMLPSWESRSNKLVFRGSSKGCGTSQENNIRLQALDYFYTNSGKLGEKVDFKITNWDTNTILLEDNTFSFTKGLREFGQDPTLDQFILPISETGNTNYIRQLANNKYILYLDSYGASLKYSYLMTLGSVIVTIKSNNKLWYTDMLHPFKLGMDTVDKECHIELDSLDEMETLINWIDQNDTLAKKIAENCKSTASQVFNKQFIFDYLQYVLTGIHNKYDLSVDYSSYAIRQFIRENGGEHSTKTLTLSNKLYNVINDNYQILGGRFNVELQLLENNTITISGEMDYCEKLSNYIDSLENWRVIRISNLNDGLRHELDKFKSQVENHYDVYTLIKDTDVYVFGNANNLEKVTEILNNSFESMPLIAWYANRKITLKINMLQILDLITDIPIAIVLLSAGEANLDKLTEFMDKNRLDYELYKVSQAVENALMNKIPNQITIEKNTKHLKPNYLAMLKIMNNIISSKYERLLVLTSNTRIDNIALNLVSELESVNRDMYLVNSHLLYVKNRHSVKSLPDLHFGMELSNIPNIENMVKPDLINVQNSNPYEYNYNPEYEKLGINYDTNKFFTLKQVNGEYLVDYNSNCLPLFLENPIEIDGKEPFDYLLEYLQKYLGELSYTDTKKKTSKRLNYPHNYEVLIERIARVVEYLYLQNGRVVNFITNLIDDGVMSINYVARDIKKQLEPVEEKLPYFTINGEYYIHDYTISDAKEFSNKLQILKSKMKSNDKLRLPSSVDKSSNFFITRVGDYIFLYDTGSDSVKLYDLTSNSFVSKIEDVFEDLDTNLMLFIYKNNNDSLLKLVLENRVPKYRPDKLDPNKLRVPELANINKLSNTNTNKYDLLNSDIKQFNYPDRIGEY
jgi:DNA-directed RNA polymerase II subunit RPB2